LIDSLEKEKTQLWKMESQLTRPYGHEQAEEPIRIHHPGIYISMTEDSNLRTFLLICLIYCDSDTEEEEHHEKGASKVLKKVKEKAKKIKNSLTKHGNGHDHDVEDDDDKYDEQDPEVHGAPG